MDFTEGLKKLKSAYYDLVLIDFTMPEVSGVDVCKFMNHDDELKDIPVMIVSAMPINSKEFQQENDNFQNFPMVKGLIEKPFEVEDLLKKVEGVLA
ncbi:MAG: response regulator [bacterium]